MDEEKVVDFNGLKLVELEPIPPGDNPFWHDSYNMGTPMGKNLFVMYPNFPEQNAPYIILVHVPTGKRTRVVL